ncbi:hypothetical protein JAAARDRAFT_512035 [Jaapia argillacea MUCL 33604]|uniref:BTB domain-containing protein n=1 Tax=Jaapia argillacea MUCL 33604 TaxID=933084 RepID=A0A067QFX2_9AGAM|nr:hypothetical protein JAAARDRAFT_512035 [Jaapia argillacea MUCL 33604]
MPSTTTAMEIVPIYSDAPAPFNKRTGDIILGSSDNVDFRTFKAILALASPVFDTMFGLPQSKGEAVDETSGESKDGVPVVPFAERSPVITNMLAFCYPTRNPTLKSLEEVLDLWEVARKYDMEALIEWLGLQLVEKRFHEKEPVRAYALGCRYHADSLIKAAAQWSLQFPITDLYKNFDELEDISAGTLVRLLKFHNRCSDVASSLAAGREFPWMTSTRYNFLNCSGCQRGDGWVPVDRSTEAFGARNWWMEFMKNAQEALKARPCKASIMIEEISMEPLKKAQKSCSKCGPLAHMELKDVIDVLGGEIEKVTSQILLEAGF